MTDIYLNKTTHDLELDGRDLRVTTNDELLAQRLTIALQFLQEEWFLDTTKGIPFTQTIIEAGKGDIETLTAIYRTAIKRVEGVEIINELILTPAGESRSLSVSLKVNNNIEIEVTI